MRIAIIPARGGSKRIPNKNIKHFIGIPIIGRVIDFLKDTDLFDRIIVSTDSKEIAEVSQQFGAEVPFMRPSTLADDFAGTNEVIAHAIQNLNLQYMKDTYICCVYPTSILMTLNDLALSLKLISEEDWRFVFAATQPNSSPLRSFRKTESGGLEMLFPEHLESRSQDLIPCFNDAGFFYWASTESWLSEEPVFGARSTFIEVPEIRAIDINTESDWIQAEMIFRIINGEISV